ncbi:MAG: hypothetical protein J2P44_10225, partial [Candidatus Dormibacteraeota bacterium]|nr:hypothetical protein [Candidatus Dormibacteraeota bacterium]
MTFVRALPGRRPLDVAVARLGHVRSREAPAGLLVARAMGAGDRPAPRVLDLLLLRRRRRAPVSQRAVEEAETGAVLEPPSDTEAGPESESPAPPAQVPPPVALRVARAVPVPERIAPEAPSLTEA